MPKTAATHQGTTPAMIQHGRVLDVDAATYRLVVATEYTKKVLSGVSFATPYQHFANGEGIYFMPEVGSLVWLCEPSDGSMPFVLGWCPAQVEGDFRSRKKDLNPGDIYLGTRDDNFLILRRGGIVQIGGGPLSQRMYLPVENMIRDFCENYSLNTLGGSLDWTVRRTETDTDGHRPSTLLLSAKQFADNQGTAAELQVGSHDGDDATILSLRIKESGDKGAATNISLKLKNDGTVEWNVKKDIQAKIGGNVDLQIKGNVVLKADGTVSLESVGAGSYKGSTFTAEASTGPATVKSPTNISLDAPLVQAGGTGAVIPVVLATPLFLLWLATHVHPVIAPGVPTGPPIPPPPPDLVSKTLLSKS